MKSTDLIPRALPGAPLVAAKARMKQFLVEHMPIWAWLRHHTPVGHGGCLGRSKSQMSPQTFRSIGVKMALHSNPKCRLDNSIPTAAAQVHPLATTLLGTSVPR
jgi:hypothetical protein